MVAEIKCSGGNSSKIRCKLRKNDVVFKLPEGSDIVAQVSWVLRPWWLQLQVSLYSSCLSIVLFDGGSNMVAALGLGVGVTITQGTPWVTVLETSNTRYSLPYNPYPNNTPELHALQWYVKFLSDLQFVVLAYISSLKNRFLISSTLVSIFSMARCAQLSPSMYPSSHTSDTTIPFRWESLTASAQN